jgi:hypothetical protein
MRNGLALLCGVLMLGGAATPAHALTASVSGDYLEVSGEPGEKNFVSIQPDPTFSGGSGPTYLISEAGIAETHVGSGCEEVLPRAIRCVVEFSHYEPSLILSLGDGNDTAIVSGAFMYGEFHGGPGDDRLDLRDTTSYVGSTVTGDRGRDNLNTRNRGLDRVDCGGGTDVTTHDPFDELVNC